MSAVSPTGSRSLRGRHTSSGCLPSCSPSRGWMDVILGQAVDPRCRGMDQQVIGARSDENASSGYRHWQRGCGRELAVRDVSGGDLPRTDPYLFPGQTCLSTTSFMSPTTRRHTTLNAAFGTVRRASTCSTLRTTAPAQDPAVRGRGWRGGVLCLELISARSALGQSFLRLDDYLERGAVPVKPATMAMSGELRRRSQGAFTPLRCRVSAVPTA